MKQSLCNLSDNLIMKIIRILKAFETINTIKKKIIKSIIFVKQLFFNKYNLNIIS